MSTVVDCRLVHKWRGTPVAHLDRSGDLAGSGGPMTQPLRCPVVKNDIISPLGRRTRPVDALQVIGADTEEVLATLRYLEYSTSTVSAPGISM